MSKIKLGKAQVLWGLKNKENGMIYDAFYSRSAAREWKEDDVSVVKVEVREIK